ncbi:MAG TPA: alpha/beta hydrolase [Aldersonia sp.]
MSDEQSWIAERFVSIDGIRTRVLSVDGEGPTILLLHGFSDSADSFRPLLAELAARSRRAVAVDLPGAGHAAPMGRPPLSSLDRFVDGFVREFAGDAGAVVAGNSLGGLLALRAAARPDLPLVAAGGLCPGGLAYHRRLETLAQWVSRLDPVLRMVDYVPVPASLLRRLAQSFYLRRLARGRGGAEIARLYAEHIGSRRDISRIRRDLIAIHHDDTLLDSEALRAIAVPVLLIWGDRDRLADVSGAPALLDTVADSRLVLLADCGHCPQVEYPQLTAELLATLPASAMTPTADEHPTPDPTVSQGSK